MNTIEVSPARDPGERDTAQQLQIPAVRHAIDLKEGAAVAQAPAQSNFHFRDLFEDQPDRSATTVSETKEKADQETRGLAATSVREQLAGQQDGHDRTSPTHRANSASWDDGELPDTSAVPNSKVGIGDASAIDEAFATNLEARMAKSDLKELGWRDRDDLDDVMRDLERLAGASWKKAATLWDKHRPGDDDKPIFIDGDDKDPFPAPGTATHVFGQRSVTDLAKGSDPLDTPPDANEDKRDNKVAVPKSLVKRYLVADNKFYFRDDPNLLAFEDKGKRLATAHNDPQVAKSMVELAEAKHWQSIKVKGTEEFKREVWLAASLRGLDVQGYEPSEAEKAKLSELMQERQTVQQNSIENGIVRDKSAIPDPVSDPSAVRAKFALPVDQIDESDEANRNLTKQQKIAVDTLRAILTERGDSPKAVDMVAQMASERLQQQRVYVGRLVAHGSAPYNNDPNEKPNYFITLKTINGEKTVWGVDLERAVAADGAQPGDDLAVVYRGKKTVTVLTNERDGDGKLTGRQVDTSVNRNTWEVGKLDKMREEAKTRVREAAAQGDRTQPVVKVYDVAASRKTRVPLEPAKPRVHEPTPPR